MVIQEEEEGDGPILGEAGWPDFHWLTDDLAVGGSFPRQRSGELARDHGIGAVVDMRQEERDDEELLRAAGIAFLHLPTPDMQCAGPDVLERGVQFAQEHLASGKKVLIHCQHGIGRSALLALCVMVGQGWDPIEALSRAKSRRGAVSPSRSQYEGWVRWLALRGKAAPDYHTFGCIAYRNSASD